MSEQEQMEEYMRKLGQAHQSAQQALDMLYGKNAVKRSLLYRMLLGRAQSILIGLYVQERGREHEHRSIQDKDHTA